MPLFKIESVKNKSKKNVVAVGSGSAGHASAGSKISACTGASKGLSHAASEVCLQLDKLLRDIDYGQDAEDLGFSFDKYLQKLEQIPKHKTNDDLKLYSFTDEEKTLLKLAIEASSRAYQENVDSAADYKWISKHESRGKPIVIKEYVNDHTLVVGIKGTVMMEDCGLKSMIHDGPHMLADWGLNFNNEPLLASQLYHGQIQCHRGFLKMAQTMEERIADEITRYNSHSMSPLTLLFTGHSAGGAIAQLLYALSHSAGSKLSVASGGSKVHCITFGCPPIAKPAIPSNPGDIFMSVINDGDVVPLAQTEYMRTLLEILASPLQEVKDKVQRGFELPEPFYGFSGQLIILRDKEVNDARQPIVTQACEITPDELSRHLFGNPKAHPMQEYRDHIERILRLR